MTAVRNGRQSSCRDVGKRITISANGGKGSEEESDLVLWTAGELRRTDCADVSCTFAV